MSQGGHIRFSGGTLLHGVSQFVQCYRAHYVISVGFRGHDKAAVYTYIYVIYIQYMYNTALCI